MDIKNLALNSSENECKSALVNILNIALNPSLGSTSKRELELAVLESLSILNIVSKNPTVFELMQLLRISKSRARGLLYDRDIRSLNKAELDKMARIALSKPRLLSRGRGSLIAIDIDNPVLSEHVKDVVRSKGYTFDNSFSSNLIQLHDEAAAALIDHYVQEAFRKSALDVFHKVGMKDDSLKGILLEMIRHGGEKLLGEAAGSINKHLSETVSSLLNDHAKGLGKAISLFLKVTKTITRFNFVYISLQCRLCSIFLCS